MKNQNTQRKLRIVLLAAIIGAVLFVLITSMPNLAYKIMGAQRADDSGFGFGLALIVSIPSMMIGKVLGASSVSGAPNPFIVNTLLGAIIFATVALFWQFCFKKDNHEK